MSESPRTAGRPWATRALTLAADVTAFRQAAEDATEIDPTSTEYAPLVVAEQLLRTVAESFAASDAWERADETRRRAEGSTSAAPPDMSGAGRDDQPADLLTAVAAASAALRLALAAVGPAGRDMPGDPVREQLRGAVVRAESALHVLRGGHTGPPLPNELRDRARAVLGAAGVETSRADAWAQDFWVRQDDGIGNAAPADLWFDERGRVAVRALLELTLHRPPGPWG